MNEQVFGTKLFDASVKCIDIAGVAHCIADVDVNSKTAAMWLNSAICHLASQIESLADTLTELEEEFHNEGKFKYPGEVDTHTHRLNHCKYQLKVFVTNNRCSTAEKEK